MAQIGANVPLAAKAAMDVPGGFCLSEPIPHKPESIFAWSEADFCPIAGVRPEGPDSSDLDVRAAEAGAPATFFCPISFKCFRDPVLLPTGQTYVTLCMHTTCHVIFIVAVPVSLMRSSSSAGTHVTKHDMSCFVSTLCVCLSRNVHVCPDIARRIHLCKSEVACMNIVEEIKR